TDKSGFAMRRGIKGSGRKRILLSAPPCYHPKRRGERRRKNVRGETISEDIAQINTIIVEKGSKPVEELLGKGEEKKEK
ncbi:MAG: 30S ribosomal protein S6e, partial [Methanobacteriota archaeon]